MAANMHSGDAETEFIDAMFDLRIGTLVEQSLATLRLLQWRTGADGIAIATVDASTGTHSLVAASGYSAEVEQFVVSTDFVEDSAGLQFQLRNPEVLIGWSDRPFPDTEEFARLVEVTNYRDGLSLPLIDDHHRLVGMLHANTARPRFDSEARNTYLGLRTILTNLLINLHVLQSSHLTPREVQVLRLLREGYTNADIARRLFVAERTVGSHVENIFRKTGSSNRLQAAMWAFRMAL